MTENLLYIVARHNVERILGDRRFDFVDDDFIEAVVRVGEALPGGDKGEAIASAFRGVKTAPSGGVRNLVKQLREGRK